MNIVISPLKNMSTGDVFKYFRMVRSALDVVCKKHPNTPMMKVSMDDFSCVHNYEFTGTATPATIKNPSYFIARCTKCPSQIAIKPRVTNAESIKETSTSRSVEAV